MIDILNRSSQIIKQAENKVQGYVCSSYTDINGCFTCLRNGFQTQGGDTYNCITKLAFYTINYGPIYVSEIYHFFDESQFLQNNFTNIVRPVNIMSLGCGFGVDDIALNKYRNDKQLPINFNYMGYDIEPLWNYISNTNSLPITYDIMNGFNCTGVDILFINKLFSTLKNHNLNAQFLSALQVSLQSLSVGSFVIFNDINHRDMGRDEFHNFALENSLEIVKKYYFNVLGTNGNSAYNGGYTEISESTNICQIPQNLPYAPKPNANQTVFFLYKKVVAP